MKSEEKISEQYYDIVAKEYHNKRTKEHPEGWFYNEMTEMPAIFELLGNVKGKKILDFGCGTGIHAKILKNKSAIVKGFDISPEMIKIAKKENPKIEFKVGTAYDIPFKEKFDIVLASLVVHYISDWNKMFQEVKRVLKEKGIFIFSTGNPISECVERKDVQGKDILPSGNTSKKENLDLYGIQQK